MFNFKEETEVLSEKTLVEIKAQFDEAERVKAVVQRRMLTAFIENGVSSSHFGGTTGYGYDDRGRDVLDSVAARVFGTESALFRHTFASGTHTITVALFALLRPGDGLLYATGTPYDTLHKAIGKKGDGTGSLADFGVNYEEIGLLNGEVDLEKLGERCHSGEVQVVALQRSCGYSDRPSLSVEKLEKVAQFVKSIDPKIYVFIDNCYGEFVEEKEPVTGVDLLAGSLIKNPGGGIASGGGYLAGTKKAVEKAAFRATVPGIGAEIGMTAHMLRELYLGFYFAPGVVCEAVKSAIFASRLFENLGFTVRPNFTEKRTDILLSVDTNSPSALASICEGIQAASPIDSFATPIAAPMPGYDSDVIMAAGAFTSGSSIELSCDGPMRPPYTAYLQGGLNFEASRLAILGAMERLQRD